MSVMPFEDLEIAYETLATAIDSAGPEREALFLTRLALVLGHELGDLDCSRIRSPPPSKAWNSRPFCRDVRGRINFAHPNHEIFSWGRPLLFMESSVAIFAAHHMMIIILIH